MASLALDFKVKNVPKDMGAGLTLAMVAILVPGGRVKQQKV